MKESNSAKETFLLGMQFGQILGSQAVVALFGDLGSGKTTFMKGLVYSLTKTDPGEVSSPTFTFLQIYEGSVPVFHFDLYRLSSDDDFQNMGFDEYFHSHGVCCIEWPEKIERLLPPSCLRIYFSHAGGDLRLIEGIA